MCVKGKRRVAGLSFSVCRLPLNFSWLIYLPTFWASGGIVVISPILVFVQ